MKLLFHTHTCYSKDCLISIDAFRKKCLKLDVIPIITDHNTIKGALEYTKRFGMKSGIIGEEIMTKQGEIIALYLNKEIAPYQDIDKTLELCKKQKAIVIVPHPFDRLRTSRLDHVALKKHKHKIDFIEIYNSRTMYNVDNKRAEYFSKKNNKLEIIGADAHWLMEFKNSIIECDDFDITKKSQFLEAFKSGKVLYTNKKSPILVHAMTKMVKILGLNRLVGKNKS